jgi:hypothetical protein
MNDTQAASQHLANNFHEARERRFSVTQGGTISATRENGVDFGVPAGVSDPSMLHRVSLELHVKMNQNIPDASFVSTYSFFSMVKLDENLSKKEAFIGSGSWRPQVAVERHENREQENRKLNDGRNNCANRTPVLKQIGVSGSVHWCCSHCAEQVKYKAHKESVLNGICWKAGERACA